MTVTRENSPFNLACDETVRDTADTGAAVALDGWPKEAELAHLREQVVVELYALC